MLLRPQGIVSSSGPEAVELAAACGLILDPWQADGLFDAMGERADGSWAAATVALICSRQNGKNDEVNACELFGLTVLHERIIHSAHRFKTALESFDRLVELVKANFDVNDYLTDKYRSPASGYEMKFRGGGRIVFLARSNSSGRGFAGFNRLVFDEAQDLTDDAQGAMKPTISACPGAQTWYLGSAPGLTSPVLHRIRNQGRAGTDTRLSYREHSADPDLFDDDRSVEEIAAAMRDPAVRAQANPAYPGRITDETIDAELLEMSTEMFLRERLSVSPELELAAGVIPAEQWDAVCSPDVTAVAQCFAVDLNPERSAGGIVAAGEGPILEVVGYGPGVSWLEGRAVDLYEKYHVPIVIAVKGPAGSLIAPLEKRGVTVVAVSEDEMVKAAGDFYDKAIEGHFSVRSNIDLDRAVKGAEKRMVGDAFTWGRKGSKGDISLLCAATAALHQQAQGVSGPSAYVSLSEV